MLAEIHCKCLIIAD